MSGINNIPIYHNGHNPEPIVPRDFDTTCPHCMALGFGKIDEYELQFVRVSTSSENGISTHLLIYGRDSEGKLKYIAVPIVILKQNIE